MGMMCTLAFASGVQLIGIFAGYRGLDFCGELIFCLNLRLYAVCGLEVRVDVEKGGMLERSVHFKRRIRSKEKRIGKNSLRRSVEVLFRWRAMWAVLVL
jgi:hypothetical protein